LFDNTDLNTAVRQAWRAAPTSIPEALELLAEQKKAAFFIQALPTDEAREWLQALTQTFALRELHTIFSYFTPGDTVQRVDDRQPVTVRDAHPTQHLTSSTEHLVQPLWRRWAPEAVDSALTNAQQLLLGIGLMLQRTPLVVRSPSFAQAIQHWIHAEPPLLSTRGENTYFATPTAPVSAQTSARQCKTTEAAPLLSLRRSPQEKLFSDFPASERAGAALNTATGKQNHGNSPGAFISETADEEHHPFSAPARTSELLSLEQTRQTTQRATREIETAFGGVFYLVNLVLCLGLYGDFTNPLRPGISLPLWDFVALVGRELVGRRIEGDPVWTLLAELAGRADGEEPNAVKFSQPVIASAAKQSLLWGDCFVAYAPCNDTGADLNTMAHTRSEDLPPVGREGSAQARERLTCWLDQFMPYLRERLQQALGLTEENALGAVLCRHWARVTATPTHIDVSLSLADLPIAIRLAGLDRDPGWVPAAGRSLAFHFV
jgi:hypothetical protein